MMKRMAHIVLAVAFVGMLAGQTFSITASAHGGCGNGHHSNSAPVYYCDGHEAHEHNNGVCPYTDTDTDTAQNDSDITDNSESNSSDNQTDSTSARRTHRKRVMQNLSDVICMY